MNFYPGEPLAPEHRFLYTEKFEMTGVPMSGLCFNNRIAWGLGEFYRIKLIEDLVCLYCEGKEEGPSKHVIFPLGDITGEKLQNIVDYYYPQFENEGLPMKLMYVPEKALDLIKSLDGYSVEIVSKRDYDEYVYESSKLIKLSGKALKSKKNQFNKFFRECSGCTYHSLTADDKNDCLKLAEEWAQEKGVDLYDYHNSDYLPIKLIFDNFDKLDVKGGLIKLFNKVIAFSIGSPSFENTAFIHFEKADHGINGANVAIISLVLENEYPGVKYVNREEDMGIEGLRIAKESYNPVFMTKKIDVFLTKR